MSLFKKPTRKFRQRETRDDSEDENGDVGTHDFKVKPTNNNTKTSTSIDNARLSNTLAATNKDDKTDPVLPKVTKLLSFHDEEDETGEVFKLKKSNYSRRLAKQRERERKKKEESQLSGNGQKNDVQEIDRKDSGFSKQTEKKPKESLSVFAGNDAEDMEVESEDEEEKVNPFKDVLASGVIPDAATIYAMKKHRQMARDMGDFVPIEEPEKDDDANSRLIRDDDNDRSDDDDEPSRMNFTIDTGAVERQKLRETFLSLQEGNESGLENEDAAELERWEREQIKKGVGVVLQAGPINTAKAAEAQLYSYQKVDVAITGYVDQRLESHPVPIDFLKSRETNLTTSDIKARLQERLNMLQTVHRAHMQELDDCDKALIESSDLVKKLTIEAPKREDNFSLFQQMSAYVKDLVECMDVKAAHIDMLDGRMVNLYKAKAQKLSARRQLDIRDQSDEYSTLSTEVMKGVNVEFLSEKNNHIDESRRARTAEREGRRMRRRKQRERQSISNTIKHQDGMSSDDEEPDIDVIQFKEAKHNLLSDAETIFEDVVEDFGTLEGVMLSFENWKSKQFSSYCEAYVPLCLPKIFGIFVKLALLNWNPLLEERDFEKSSWYHQLVHYGCDTVNEDDIDDPDTNLLPGVMERIVLQKVTNCVQDVWNPLSQSETSRLVNLVQKLTETYPTINGKSKQLQNCLKAITARLNKSLDDDIFIPLYPKELLESRSLGASDFFQRQFWSAVKLMQNILSWDGILAEKPLQQMALGSLLNRYLLMGLHTTVTMKDTIDKCKAIVSSLPKSWLKTLKGGYTLPLLKQFSSYLLKYADSYHSASAKRGLPSEDTKDTVKDIVQLLVIMESLDDAVLLAKKYSVSAFKS